jgi:hypothetical protein
LSRSRRIDAAVDVPDLLAGFLLKCNDVRVAQPDEHEPVADGDALARGRPCSGRVKSVSGAGQ